MATALIPREIRTRVDSWKEKAVLWQKISPDDPLAAAFAFCAKELEEAIAIDEAGTPVAPSAEVAPRPCRIYVIRRASAGEVKIGISTDPGRRLAQLQSGHSEQLELVATYSGSAAEEAELHARFAASRKRGEWFRESPEITEWIEGLG